MEAAQRTAEHHARIDGRRQSLRERCAQVLDSSTTFVWEIGCGHGHFLTAYAEAHTGELCVGVDRSRERIERAERKRARSRLAHVHFLLADADDFLAALPTAIRFSRLYILFPDPWPKRRHHKNRILTPPFLEKIAARAGEGARFFFRTDFEPYFSDVQTAIGRSASWRLSEEPWSFDTPTVFQQKAPAFHSLVSVLKN